MAYEEFVLCVKANENSEALPVLRVLIHEEVLNFYSKEIIRGWNFNEWLKEKLAKHGITLPAQYFWLEHPVFALKRIDRSLLLALPFIKI
jgi:hypothetical protein